MNNLTLSRQQIRDIVGSDDSQSIRVIEALLARANTTTPSGSVSIYAGATSPAGYLLCDGSAVSRAKYAQLFDAIGTIYGVGDGSTTFNLPDLRETAPVGVGENTTATIVGHDIYTLGQFKDDAMQGHWHEYNYQPESDDEGGPISFDQISDAPSPSYFRFDRVKNPITDGVNGTPRTGTTTHGKRIGLNYIIKI